MKKMLSICLIFVILLSSFNVSMVYAGNNNNVETANTESIYEPTPINNNYNKIHFYFGSEEYSTIDNATELKLATETLSTYSNTVIDRSACNETNTNNEISMTIEFASDFMSTTRYKEFLKERSCLKDIEEIHNFRTRLNAYSKSYHKELIRKNLECLGVINYTTISDVEYSPFVVLSVPAEDISVETLEALSSNGTIKHISLDRKTVLSPNSSFNECLTTTEAYDIVSAETYTGDGIRIGIFEACGIYDSNNINLADKDITKRSAPNGTVHSIDIHATAVTSIMALMAPDAEFFFCKADDYDGDGYPDKGLQWFIDQNCDIVNMSAGTHSYYVNSDDGTLTYYYRGYRQDFDAIYDYQIRASFITLVCSAGDLNENNTQDGYNPGSYINSPGFAYNAITVGGVSKNSSGEWVHDSIASYVVLSSDSPKPDVSAPCIVDIPNVDIPNDNIPGTYIDVEWWGTSFSAPQVTACIAMLMEKDSSYMCHPEKVHAVITATATKTDDFGSATGFNSKVGAGVVNLPKMLSYTTNLHQINNNAIAGREIFSMEMFLDQFYDFGVAISWLAYVYDRYDDVTDEMEYELHNTNYNLYVYDSNDNCIYSNLYYSAVELVRFSVPESDTYRIVIYQAENLWSLNNGDHIAISYYVDEGSLE